MFYRVKPNHSFINKIGGTCQICDNYELVLSSVAINFNYGSENDGERIKLNICGKCADALLSTIQIRAGG